jgi:hypothetical protein
MLLGMIRLTFGRLLAINKFPPKKLPMELRVSATLAVLYDWPFY